MNKKGTEGLWWMIAIIVIVGLFIIFGTQLTQQQFSSVKQVWETFTGCNLKDYDQDGLTLEDMSPCLSGKKTIVDRNGVTQYYLSEGGTDGELCENELFPELVAKGLDIEKSYSKSHDAVVCIITHESCAQVLAEYCEDES